MAEPVACVIIKPYSSGFVATILSGHLGDHVAALAKSRPDLIKP
jgi:hypothetical protein